MLFRISWGVRFAINSSFIDGSFQDHNNLSSCGGVGGFIMNTDIRVVFIFQGPSAKQSSYDIELEAMMIQPSCIVLTDSTILVNNILKFKCGSVWSQDFSCLNSNELVHKISLAYISRHLDESADWLSNQGAKRAKILAAWIVRV